MAIFNIGRVGFHRGEKTIADAMNKAMDQDTIRIMEKKTAIDQTMMFRGGVVLEGDPNNEAPVIVGPSRQPAIMLGSNFNGATITLRHLRLQLDESSIGLRINADNAHVILDDVQIYHKHNLNVGYNGLIIDTQPTADVEIKNSLIDKVGMRVNTVRIVDSNIGDWFWDDASQIICNQASISGTALQNTLIAGNSNQAQAQIANSALGGNVRFNRIQVMGDTIALTQLPIINHRGNSNLSNQNDGATALIIGNDSKINFKHVTQNPEMDASKTKLPLPKWRSLGLVGGSVTIDDAYLTNTSLKNVAKGGDLTFINVTDDSQWATANQWGAGPKLHLSNKNSKSAIFDAQDGLNSIPSGISGQPAQSKSALKQLDEMIGLGPVKNQVKQIVAQAKANAEREKRGLGNSKLKRRLGMIFAGNAGSGKSIKMSEKIVTPSGWRRFGDLQVGDLVYGPDGQPTTVLGRYPKGKLDVYRVELSDGRHLDVSKDHLFSVYNNCSKKRQQLHTMSVQQMIDNGVHHITNGLDRRTGQNRVRVNSHWAIPMNKALMYPEKYLSVDPYAFGALIAEGSLHSGRDKKHLHSMPLIMTSNDEFVVAKVADRLGVKYRRDLSKVRHYSWRFDYVPGDEKTFIRQNGHKYVSNVVHPSDIMPEDELVTAPYKFIPDEYKLASYDQRLELLRGLFDTDGSISPAGGRCQVRYSTVSERLAYDVRELLLSMGYDATISHRKRKATKASRHPHVEYSIMVLASIQDKMKLFTLPRHLDKFKPYAKHRIRRDYSRIAITDIYPLHQQAEMMCIFVDNPSHLYVAGDFVVTHNTTVAKLVGQALYEAGVLPSSKFVNVGAADLVSQYVGKTAAQTHEVILKALDGVLLIDEAYALNGSSDGGGGNANSFNQDAITQLVKDMDLYANRLVVIAAGYSQPMKQFLANNQGLQSRFPNWIEFPDYSPTELKLIMRLDLKRANARLSNPQVIQVLDRGIDTLLPIVSRGGNGSGNGRFVDNYVQRVTEMRDNRLAQEDMSKLSDLQLMIIKPQDVQQAVEVMRQQHQNMG